MVDAQAPGRGRRTQTEIFLTMRLRDIIAEAPRLVAYAVEHGWCSAPVVSPPFSSPEINYFRTTGRLTIRRQEYADAAAGDLLKPL